MKVSKRDRVFNFLDPIVEVMALVYIAVVVLLVAALVVAGIVALLAWVIA